MINRIRTVLYLTVYFLGLGVFTVKGGDSQFGLITLSVANVRSEPRHSSELVSQALCGTPVEIIEQKGEWVCVRMPDNYSGYIHSSSVALKNKEEMDNWKRSRRIIVSNPNEILMLSDTCFDNYFVRDGIMVSDLTGGCIVELVQSGVDYSLVQMPDGRKGYVRNYDIFDLNKFVEEGTDTDICLHTAKSMTGVPYLWGGISSKGLDCSGLVRNAYFSTGIILSRDASEQANHGIDIPISRPDLWLKGDLLFFSDEKGERITHVGIYDSDGDFIHSSGKVYISNIYKDRSNYLPREVIRVVRVRGCEDTSGITRLRNHPWYFVK